MEVSKEPLQALINKKNKKWKGLKVSDDRNAFDAAFAKYNRLNTQSYENYVAKMKSNLKSNPASF